jgi:hypothetical protein
MAGQGRRSPDPDVLEIWGDDLAEAVDLTREGRNWVAALTASCE